MCQLFLFAYLTEALWIQSHYCGHGSVTPFTALRKSPILKRGLYPTSSGHYRCSRRQSLEKLSRLIKAQGFQDE